MSQVAIVIDTSDIPTTALGSQLEAAKAALAKVKQDVAQWPGDTLSNETRTADVADNGDTSYSVTARKGVTPKCTIDAVTVSASALTALTAAEVAADITAAIATMSVVEATGGAAGDITATGVAATSVIVSVGAIKDADQTFLDLTSEFAATGTDTINNTGGTATTGYHLVVAWYDPS